MVGLGFSDAVRIGRALSSNDPLSVGAIGGARLAACAVTLIRIKANLGPTLMLLKVGNR
jgi:hypothetical protein